LQPAKIRFSCLSATSFTQKITVYFSTFDAGLVNGFTKVNRIYSVDLYDTTMDYQDIQISDELIKSQLMWPDMSLSDTKDDKDQEKYVKHKDFDKWADICVTEVIDACHFWAHVGGKHVTEKIEGITQRLLSAVNNIFQLFTVISLSFFISFSSYSKKSFGSGHSQGCHRHLLHAHSLLTNL